MNRNTYSSVRKAIRGNGLAYTARIAAQQGDIDALTICDAIINTTKGTDWLAMRQQFARNEHSSIAFKLTATVSKQ